jgi:hypothetical protein
MRISPIYTLPQYDTYLPAQNNQSKNFGLSLKPQLNQDVVSFTGYRRFLELPKVDIIKRICRSINAENFIGSGGEANVYAIQGTKYCFRCPKGSQDTFVNCDIDLFPTEADKVNHVVAKLGSGATIMNKLRGVPVRSESMTPEQIQLVAQTIVDLPVQSYRKFLHQLADADKKNMYFDNFWPNVIINGKDKTITAVDFVKDFPYAEDFDPLNKMYSVLTHEDTAIDHRAAIVNKIFKAALKELSPGQKPCIHPEQFDFAILLTELRFSNHFKLPDDSYCDLFKAFNRIIELKMLELKGENVTSMLRNDIKVAKDIIDLMF